MTQDTKELTYEDIMPGVRHFRTAQIRKVEIGNRRYHREYMGYDTFETPAFGEIRVTEWTQIAKEVIRRNGEEKLLAAIMDYVNKYCTWLKEDEKITYAAQCLLYKSYEAWAKRGEFVI